SAFTARVPVRWRTDQSSIEAWPFDSTKRSRFGQIGSSGSKCMTRFQSVYTSGASAIGVPGCPDFACCTASIDRVRIVLIDSWSSSSLVIVSPSFLQRRDLAEAPEVSLRPAAVGRQERLDEVPGHGRADGSAAHAEDVHVIVLDSLPSREVVV